MKNGLFSLFLIAISLVPCVIFVAGMSAIFGEGGLVAYISYPLGLLVWFYTTKELDRFFSKKSVDNK
jgi:type IV secretory pathway VirB2 component (pilin)